VVHDADPCRAHQGRLDHHDLDHLEHHDLDHLGHSRDPVQQTQNHESPLLRLVETRQVHLDLRRDWTDEADHQYPLDHDLKQRLEFVRCEHWYRLSDDPERDSSADELHHHRVVGVLHYLEAAEFFVRFPVAAE